MAEERFDAVVVGSGFGGAVMCYRLAAAGQAVCLLERGKKWPPGSFPRSVHGVGRSTWDPSEKLWGPWDAWSFENFDAMVASGLGGGSLLYANVLLRKPPAWFRELDGRPWPVTYDQLAPHYDAVEAMLQPQRYPLHEQRYQVPKAMAYRDATTALGYTPELPQLAVYFADPETPHAPVPGAPLVGVAPNLHGAPRVTCTLCGECNFGCNTGAKNTLDYNYLSRAELDHGASVRASSEVMSFWREDGRWIVEYREHHPDDDDAPATLRRVSAERLILSAGALGSPYLLLRMREALRRGGIELPASLGTRVSANGDLFAVMLGARRADGKPRELAPGRGPSITQTIHVPDETAGGETVGGFYLQEAISPDFLSWAVEFAWTPGLIKRAFCAALDWLESRGGDPNMSDEVARLIGDGALSSSSLPLLGMGRDVPSGKMRLDEEGKYLEVDWGAGANDAYFARLERVVREVAGAMGGPIGMTSKGKRRTFTVHPLGGCPMGRDASDGVVDAWGRVMHAQGGVVPGLYVADGSVMPGPVGPNPSLTIAALSDRFASGILGAAPAAAVAPARID
jgi:cholesterol oxidase